MTLALLVALVCAGAVAIWQAHLARQEAQRANAEALRAHTVRNLLVDLFDAEIPRGPRDQMPDTAELLARGTERALRDLKATPAVQSELLTALGRVYDHLSQPDKGEPLLDAAVDAARRVQPPDPGLLGAALSERGELEISRSRDDAATPLLDEAIALQESVDPDSVTLAVSLDRRALVASRSGDHDRAIALYRRANNIRDRQLAPSSPEHFHSANALGVALMSAGRYDEAEPLLRKAADGALAHFGEAHVKSAHYLKNLATLHGFMGRTADAAGSLRRAVATERLLYPPDSPDRGLGLNNLGTLELRLGQPQAALALFEEARTLNANAGLELSLGQSFVLGNLARTQEMLGDLPAAARTLDHADAAARTSVGADHPRTVTLALQRARVRFLLDSGHAAQLLSDADTVIAALESLRTLRARSEPEARYARAFALAAMDREAEALSTLDSAFNSLPGDHVDPMLLPFVADHAEWLHRHDRSDEARWLLAEQINRATQALPADHLALGRLHLAAADVAVDPGIAASHADAALSAFGALPDSHPWRLRAQALSGLAH